jgi:pyrroloquinoline quinone (PQQ) biosynthesis protein C
VSFVDELLAAARPWDITTSPFLVALQAGSCDRDTIRRYALHLHAAAVRFPRVLSHVLTFCDAEEIRRTVLGNLLEEEGVVRFSPGSGVVVAPERKHSAMSRRLARAAGASDEEIDAERISETRWFRDARTSGDWVGVFCFFAIGYESNVPATFRIIYEALLNNYAFAADDLEFLSEHFTADERHGRESAEAIAAVGTETQRRRALEAARRGGTAWWVVHRQFAQ